MEKTANERRSKTFADFNSRHDKILHGSSLRLPRGASPALCSTIASDAPQDHSWTIPLPIIKFSGIIIPPRGGISDRRSMIQGKNPSVVDRAALLHKRNEGKGLGRRHAIESDYGGLESR